MHDNSAPTGVRFKRAFRSLPDSGGLGLPGDESEDEIVNRLSVLEGFGDFVTVRAWARPSLPEIPSPHRRAAIRRFHFRLQSPVAEVHEHTSDEARQIGDGSEPGEQCGRESALGLTSSAR